MDREKVILTAALVALGVILVLAIATGVSIDQGLR